MIDFNAVAADGKPVTDLTPADVTVRIGGKPRTITSLTLKTISGGAAQPATPEGDTASPPFATNEPKAAAASGGRSILIVVDTESLRAGTEAGFNQAIEALLAGLGAGDRVALSTAPRDTVQVGFGTSLPKVREAVASLRGQRPATVSTADALCRTRDTLTLLKGLVEQFTGSETPTSVVFIASGLSTPARASGSSGTCEVLSDNYNSIAASAAAARANMYVVQGDPSTMGRDNGLENLAGVTGAGQVLRVVNEGFAPRVLADSSAYWLASIAPDPGDRPGSQRLEVRAVREGVTVHSRQEAAIPRPGAAPGRPAAGGGGGAKSPKEMIATTAPFTDLQLRAIAYSSRGAADKMNVFVFAEPVDPATKITAMSIGFFDQTGKGGSIPAPSLTTSPITTLLPLGAGEYRIRVAATDSTGKSGAVDVTINTALTLAGPLKLGGLLLVTPNDKGENKPRLMFSTEDKIVATLEMFGQITAPIGAKFELARTDVGPAINVYPTSSGGPTNEPDKFQINGEIPIGNLEPGDYVIRAIVQMEGQPEGRVMRTFRKIAK